jgi:hypothetical protein
MKLQAIFIYRFFAWQNGTQRATMVYIGSNFLFLFKCHLGFVYSIKSNDATARASAPPIPLEADDEYWVPCRYGFSGDSGDNIATRQPHLKMVG